MQFLFYEIKIKKRKDAVIKFQIVAVDPCWFSCRFVMIFSMFIAIINFIKITGIESTWICGNAESIVQNRLTV